MVVLTNTSVGAIIPRNMSQDPHRLHSVAVVERAEEATSGHFHRIHNQLLFYPNCVLQRIICRCLSLAKYTSA